jgi:hypothetical protein
MLVLVALLALAQETWDKNVGQPAPKLFAAGWIGTPVSLDALRKTEGPAAAEGDTVAGKVGAIGGNTVVLAFWNADIPC